LATLPLTNNGKVDKKALPDVDLNMLNNGIYVSPESDTEIILAGFWRELLGLDRVGVQDNFFELGGHSLTIVRLLSRLRKNGYLMHAKDVFVYQTIREQAAFLERCEPTKLLQAHIVPLNRGGVGFPLFIVPGSDGICDEYDELAKAFETDCPVYGLLMMGVDKDEDPLTSMEEIAKQNIKWIKQIQPDGPYRFIGHSFGGHVVYEMVKQLENAGEQVGFAVLLDVAATVGNSLLHIPVRLPPNETDAEFDHRLQKLRLCNSRIVYTIEGKVNAPLIVVRGAGENWNGCGGDLGWADHSHTLETFVSPGDHFGMIKDGNAVYLAENIRRRLNL